MSAVLQALRFFRAADATPNWLAVLTAVVGLYAAGIAAVDPAGVDEALALLLLWQMFCASSGFLRHASAGHFDAALVRWPRIGVAIGHALHSIWLVIALWFAVAGIETLRTHEAPVALEPGRVAALTFVSCASWVVALPAARLVTGSLWLALIVATVTTPVGADQYTAMLARPDGSLPQQLHAAALALVCPFLLVGDHLPPRAAAASALFAASVVALAAGIAYVRRRDYPLEAAL